MCNSTGVVTESLLHFEGICQKTGHEMNVTEVIPIDILLYV